MIVYIMLITEADMPTYTVSRVDLASIIELDNTWFNILNIYIVFSNDLILKY